MANPGKASFGAIYILCLDEDGRGIRSSTEPYVAHYRRPESGYGSQRLHVYSDKGQHLQASQLRFGCLFPCTLKDKVLVVAHGGVDNVNRLEPDDLAARLKAWGLHEAGLITFKACNVGRGSFLTEFVRQCSFQGIRVGWVKGYRGTARTIVYTNGKVSEEIEHELAPGMKMTLYDDSRYTIVQGNHATNHGGRFVP